jgi:hypothetical protein
LTDCLIFGGNDRGPQLWQPLDVQADALGCRTILPGFIDVVLPSMNKAGALELIEGDDTDSRLFFVIRAMIWAGVSGCMALVSHANGADYLDRTTQHVPPVPAGIGPAVPLIDGFNVEATAAQLSNVFGPSWPDPS